MNTMIKRMTLGVGVLFLCACLFASVGMAQEEEESLVGKTVNINTAEAEEFVENVPLMTEELAEAIIEYREEAGDFQVIEELLQVDGFDRTLLRKVKDFLLLEGIGGDECTC